MELSYINTPSGYFIFPSISNSLSTYLVLNHRAKSQNTKSSKRGSFFTSNQPKLANSSPCQNLVTSLSTGALSPICRDETFHLHGMKRAYRKKITLV